MNSGTKEVCVSQSCLCHGPITTKVSCAEVTHFTARLWRNMNVWLTAKPVLLLNGLLLWLRLLFSSPTKTAGPVFIRYQARNWKEKLRKNKCLPLSSVGLTHAWIPLELMALWCGSRSHNKTWGSPDSEPQQHKATRATAVIENTVQTWLKILFYI